LMFSLFLYDALLQEAGVGIGRAGPGGGGG
jgi:hypothetical protein